jgi:hypothetical protein
MLRKILNAVKGAGALKIPIKRKQAGVGSTSTKPQ